MRAVPLITPSKARPSNSELVTPARLAVPFMLNSERLSAGTNGSASEPALISKPMSLPLGCNCTFILSPPLSFTDCSVPSPATVASRSSGGSLSGPSSVSCLAVMRAMRKSPPATLPSNASATWDCDIDTPSRSTRLNDLRGPNSEPTSGEPRTERIFTALPIDTPSNFTSTPVIRDRRAEVIFTGTPIASEAAFS